MRNTAANTNQEQMLLSLFTGANENGKKTIIDILLCAVSYGDEFFQKMEKLNEQGNTEEMLKEINKMSQAFTA